MRGVGAPSHKRPPACLHEADNHQLVAGPHTSYPTHAVRGHNDAMSRRGPGLWLRREERNEHGPRKAVPLDAGPLTDEANHH
eukprot:3835853-Pyramimonas_sp.AAC.1